MRKYFFFILLLGCVMPNSTAQSTKKMSDARFVISPLIYVDYSFFHWAKEPFYEPNTKPRNIGKILNVLPGIGGGVIMGKKTTLLFSVEAAVRYMPFSIDLYEDKGMGSITFPLTANIRIPMKDFTFFQVGLGLQWTNIDLHNHDKAPVNYDHSRDFFMTYIGELGLGLEENLFRIYFIRMGYNSNQAITFDCGIKFGINGNLWD